MNLEIAGKTVVVTGGSAGIGLACAEAFLAEGARVAIIGRRMETLKQAQQHLASHSKDTVVIVAADLVREVEADRALTCIEESIGAVDVLINCAGAAKRSNYRELNEAAWRAGFESKFMPYINMCTVVLRRFEERRRNSLENPPKLAVVNVIGKGGKSPSATHLPGGAANAALMLATAGLAQVWGGAGVRINAVNPASIATDRLRRRLVVEFGEGTDFTSERVQAEVRNIPLGRFGEPREVANVVLFLASECASYVLGSNVVMDGGLRPII